MSDWRREREKGDIEGLKVGGEGDRVGCKEVFGVVGDGLWRKKPDCSNLENTIFFGESLILNNVVACLE